MAKPDVIPAPPAQPPRYGLIASAPIPEGNERWEMGGTWEPEACANFGPDSGPYGCSPLAARSDQKPGIGTETAWPILLWGLDACSALDRNRDWQGRARRMLESTQSAMLAHEVWTGEITSAANPGDESPFLADGAAFVLEGGAAVTLNDAIAEVEGAASADGLGRRLMLHMHPQVLAAALGEGSTHIVRDGNLLVTMLGNLVVPDAGYPGTPPDGEAGGGNHWIYTSGIITVRLGAVETLPRSFDDARELAATVDRSTNDQVVWAQRPALYQLDTCQRFAIQTDVPLSITGS